MKGRNNSIEISTTAVFSAILTVVEVVGYNFTYPILPPVAVTPFFTSFILAMSIPFTKKQWMMGLIASLITNISKGGFLPGPFIIPIYGFLFTTRKVKLSGALSSIIHLVYGVFLAPFMFSVAPAKIVYEWILHYLSSYVLAIVVAILIFGVGGAIAASSGYKTGLKIAKNQTDFRAD